MENTYTISKSFKRNAFWLNLVVLFRELYQTYCRVFLLAALLSLLSPFFPPYLKELQAVEASLIPLSLIALPFFLTFEMILAEFRGGNVFKKCLKGLIAQRRKIFFLFWVGGFHELSELVPALAGKNVGALVAQTFKVVLTLFLLDYFIIEAKERLEEVVFKNAHTFTSDCPLLALTSLGKEKISELTLQKHYGRPNFVIGGELKVYLKGVLLPLQRSYIRVSETEEALLNSSYTQLLFRLHKVVQGLKATVWAIKTKSLTQAKAFYLEKHAILSVKQKAGYSFIITMSVTLAFFILKAWLAK